MLESMPALMPFRRTSSVYVSGKFLMLLVPTVGLGLIGIAYLTEILGFISAVITSLFSVYLITFGALAIGFKQKVIFEVKILFRLLSRLGIGSCRYSTIHNR